MDSAASLRSREQPFRLDSTWRSSLAWEVVTRKVLNLKINIIIIIREKKKKKKYKPMKSERNLIFRRKLLSFSGKVKYLPELLLELNCLGFLMMRNSGRCNYRA